jgi:hypothetical protein
MLVHPIASSAVPESLVILSKVYPFVRELVHKYKVMVIGTKSSSWNSNPEFNSFFLSREDGIIVGKVGINREGQNYFRSVVRSKDRGRTAEDRMSYLAVKVPSLMRTIEKNKLMPDDSKEVINKMTHLSSLVQNVLSEHSNVTKSSGYAGSEIHELLKVVFGYQTLNQLSVDSINRYRKSLDEYNQVDETRVAKLNLVKEVFDKPIKFLMYDDTKTFIKGSMSIGVSFDDYYRLEKSEVVEMECKRVHTFMDDPDIAPRMAMLKVMIQNRNQDKEFAGEENFFPIDSEGYFPDLGIYKVDTDGWRYDNFPTKPQWIFFV